MKRLIPLILALAGCLSEDGPDSGPILELDARTEHVDEKKAYSLLLRLQLPEQPPPTDPNELVATVRSPLGQSWTIHGSDWSADLGRYEVGGQYVFPDLIEGGVYRAEALGQAVQDTLERRFLDLPTLLTPVYGERVGCEPILTWKAVEGAAKYQVLIRKRHEINTSLTSTVQETRFPVPPGFLRNDTLYEWKVYAFDKSAQGDVDNQSKSKFSRFLVLGGC